MLGAVGLGGLSCKMRCKGHTVEGQPQSPPSPLPPRGDYAYDRLSRASESCPAFLKCLQVQNVQSQALQGADSGPCDARAARQSLQVGGAHNPLDQAFSPAGRFQGPQCVGRARNALDACKDV